VHLTRQRVAAGLLYGGTDAVLTGLEACRRHGVRRGPDPAGEVHILVPDERQLRSSHFVVVERTTRMPPALPRDRVPLAPAARACLDAGRRLHAGAEITELIADAVQRGLCTPAQLAAELEGRRAGRPPSWKTVVSEDPRPRGVSSPMSPMVSDPRRSGMRSG